MRLFWLLLLVLPAASAVPVEMAFHHGVGVGVLHPDGVRETPPQLRAVPGPCPALAPEAWEYVGAWTVDPAQTGGGERRYFHGDHGFGHSFQITDDARVVLPILASEPIRVDATLWVGEYHLAWHGLGEGEGEEVVAEASWQGTPDGPVELVLPTQGLRIDIQDGVLLQIRVTSDLPCQPPGAIQWQTDEDAWPVLWMDIEDHASVTASAVFDDGEGVANLIVQHWRGVAGMPEPTFWIDGASVASSALPPEPDQDYHHGVAGRTYRVAVPLDGGHELRVAMHEDDALVFDEIVLSWRGGAGELQESCGREKATGTRTDGWMERCLSHGEETQTTPMPVALALLALVWAARRQ